MASSNSLTEMSPLKLCIDSPFSHDNELVL